MPDVRAYYRNDAGYFSNPKILPLLEAHPRAVLLHQAAVAFSAQHLTDGVVPVEFLMRQVYAEHCPEHCNRQSGEHCPEHCDLQCTVDSMLLEPLDATNAVVHDYLEHNRSAAQAGKASDKGKLAAESRWGKAKADASSNAPSNANGNAQEREKERRTPAADAEVFEDWWKHYPRSVGKGQARLAFKRALTKTTADVLVVAADRFTAQAKGSDPKFIPHPATWLNGERWLDIPTEPVTADGWMNA